MQKIVLLFCIISSFQYYNYQTFSQEVKSTSKLIVNETNQNKEMTSKEILDNYKNWESLAQENGYVFAPSERTKHKDTINLNVVEKWIDCYKNGQKATIKILYDGNPFPIVYTVICDGSEQYTINICTEEYVYRHKNITYRTKGVYSRKFDYIFGTDFSDGFKSPLFVPKKEFTEERLAYYNLNSDAISMQEAFSIASKAIDKLEQYTEKVSGISDSIRIDFKQEDFVSLNEKNLKLLDIIMLEGNPCYVITFFKNEEYYENPIIAISIDRGNLIYTANQRYGGWIPIYDGNEEWILPY